MRQIVAAQEQYSPGGEVKEIIYLTEESSLFSTQDVNSVLELRRERVLAPILKDRGKSAKEKARQILNEEKAKSLASILAIYGIDEHLSKDQFESLISAILEVMVLEIKK
ncbi:hypothetical protein A7329_12190 [Pseudomonas aeruginosa]|nr:hypothetical protein AM599_12190 [Pseudomonas aeruginosa]AON36645.1 hypothetical protein A7329_12190 [Pseudomonas aeruginosa]